MNENELSYSIRGAILDVYYQLGPGLLESAYVAALKFELAQCGLVTKCEVPIPLMYKGQLLSVGYRLDILVEEKVIIEVKSVENLLPVHHKQLLTYLKLQKLKLGILVNFNDAHIANGIFRKVNNL